MDEIAENCTRAAIFAEGKVVAVDSPKTLFKDGEKLAELGLDTPFTAKLVKGLAEQGVSLDCDFTVEDFVRKTLAYAAEGGLHA
jgi:ABC-type multidrug transport system ATPase subunit